MADIRDIPELLALVNPDDRIRIPNEIDVPVTPRVKRLVDTSAFRHLSGISQLGLVQWVYPGATHHRFEHSLGVYRNALIMLNRLSVDERFCARVSAKAATTFIVAALLHDIGHWPFCHPIEDLKLPGGQRHEDRARSIISAPEIANLLESDWDLSAANVADLVAGNSVSDESQILQTLLSGPLDVDKLDYLYRDSLHAGVPYGLNFDERRLISSLCLNESGSGLAIGEKGKTAAEMLVFARYVMFSEVYWHHAVRSATAMLQRAYFEFRLDAKPDEWNNLSEIDWIRKAIEAGKSTNAEFLLDGLFGTHRKLYKRIAQYSSHENSETYKKLARQPFPKLVDLSNQLATIVGKKLGQEIPPGKLLIDAPPVGLEVQFHIDIHDAKTNQYRSLGEVSPMIRTLAERQFDDMVKRVRVFVAPEYKPEVDQLPVDEILSELLG